MTLGLALSLFPGLDFLGRAFEQEGWCVVRGPDPIWGGDVRDWHVPAGLFEGVIGGPPCQLFSRMRRLNPRAGERHGNLIPEYERVVGEAQSAWFLMENVVEAPEPSVPGYQVHSQVLNNRWVGGVAKRERRFSFGTRDGRRLDVETLALEPVEWEPAVMSGSRAVPVKIGGNGKVKRSLFDGREGPGRGPLRSVEDMLALQGFPCNLLDECPLTAEGKRHAVGNGVPLWMGLAVARAVKRAMGQGVLP